MTKTCLALAGILPILAGCATQVDRGLVAQRTAQLYPDAATPAEAGQPTVPPETTPAPIGGGLEDYVAVALENNAGLRAAFARWQAAIERVPQASTLPNPQFSYTNFIEEVQTRTGPQRNRFQLSQQFPWFGTLQRRGEAASAHAESLWWDVQNRAVALTRDVKVAYYEYAYLAQAIRIVEENLTLLRNLEPIVQRRVQTGAGQGELLRLQVEIGKVENDLNTLNDRRPAISARLNALMNRPRAELLPWPPAPQIAIEQFASEQLRDRVEQANPQLKAIEQRIDEAGKQVAVAKLQKYPDFNIGVAYIDTGQAVSTPRPSDSGDDPFSFTLGLSIPIWRHKYAAAEREARAQQASQRSERVQRANDLLSDLAMTLFRYDDAVRKVSLYQDTLIPRSRQALDVTEVSYQSGTATLLDVIDTQREFLQFETAYWRAIADYYQHVAELEALCGGTLP